MAMFDKQKGSKQGVPETDQPRVSQPPPAAAPAPASGADRSTMIGRGISIAGDVTADTNLKVEGLIEGRSIQSSHDIEIGESGRVTARFGVRGAVVRIMAALAVLLVVYSFVLTPMFQVLLGLPLGMRVVIAACVVALPGLLMGMLLPCGVRAANANGHPRRKRRAHRR